MTSKWKRFTVAAAAVVAASTGIGIFLVVGPSGSTASSAVVAQPSAYGGMAALKNPTLVTDAPADATALPGDMAPAGTVTQLVENFGRPHLTVYAWRQGASNSVCYVAPRGGGGCLATFNTPFDVSFTDADALGAGEPMLVWGLVDDDVATVDITVGGQVHQADIENNVAVYQLPDASMGPDSVTAVIVTLKNGLRIPVRI